jgi:hypothetical protein
MGYFEMVIGSLVIGSLVIACLSAGWGHWSLVIGHWSLGHFETYFA